MERNFPGNLLKHFGDYMGTFPKAGDVLKESIPAKDLFFMLEPRWAHPRVSHVLGNDVLLLKAANRQMMFLPELHPKAREKRRQNLDPCGCFVSLILSIVPARPCYLSRV